MNDQRQPVIESYEPGRMTVQGQQHRKDLKILQEQVVPHWWRKSDHRLDVPDVEDVLQNPPQVLVVGTGYAGNMTVEDSLRSELKKRDVTLVEEKTDRAVERFNRLYSQGKDVAGAFHLTC